MAAENLRSFEVEIRADAHACARAGIASLARALNHFEDGEIPYRYTDDIQARFLELAREFVELVEHGGIEANPAHVHHLAVMAAHRDRAVQALLKKASRKTPIRGK